jgi:L-asparaginase II
MPLTRPQPTLSTPPLAVMSTRGEHVESWHAVHVAVTDADGRLVAAAGAPGLATWWRSAAKPFQAAAALADGALDAFGFGAEELALACASHSSEPVHRAVAARMLAACGCSEEDLACGFHPPLSSKVNRALIHSGERAGPLWSNCSGKHAAMLALCRHRGWDVAGYHEEDHPLQQRLRAEVAAWTGEAPEALGVAGDGCRARTFFLPLSAMATAWARLGTRNDDVARRLRDAIWQHPHLLAGAERPCTQLVAAAPGKLVVKVGAEGVYNAALPAAGLGVALKVESGSGAAAPVALVAVLAALASRFGVELPFEAWRELARPAVKDTRGGVVGHLEVDGALAFPG